MKNLILLSIIALAAGCSDCGGCASRHHVVQARHTPPITNVTMVRLKAEDGQTRYAYQHDDFWFYYTMMSGNNASNSSSSTYIFPSTRSDRGPVSLPSGGTWTRSTVAPKSEEVEEEQQVEIVENKEGEPESTEEITEEATQETTQAEPASEPTPSEPAATEAPSSDSSASSTSDSSAGGDSGGGGGGDSGGGGGGSD